MGAHGNQDLFAIKLNSESDYVYPEDIEGDWNLVFLDACSCLKTDKFAKAFNILVHPNKAILGWASNVQFIASSLWWDKFSEYAGEMKLDEACNLAIENMDKSEKGLIVPQIMMYGDGDWDGVAKIAEIAKKDNKK